VVNLPGEPEWLGRLLTVEITKAGPNSLSGRAVGLNTGRRRPAEAGLTWG